MRRRTLRRVLSAVAVSVVVVAIGSAGVAVGAFAGFQRRASDALFPSATADPRVVVVAIDGQSDLSLGTPLPRSVEADLARRLGAAGAAAVVWDVVFAGDRPGTDELAAALAQVRAAVLIEHVTKFGPGDHAEDKVSGALLPESKLLGKNTVLGHDQVSPDPSDGVVRSIPLVMNDRGQDLPALSLRAFAALRGDLGPPTISPDGVHLGGRFIPTEGDHRLRLNFASGLTSATGHAVVSLVDVLDGKVDPARFRGKVVLVGSTDPLLHDSQLTPTNKSGGLPGVLIHANALNTILTASYLVPVSDLQTNLWIALVALLVALAVLFLPVWLSPVVAFLIAIAYGVIAFVRFDGGHVMNLIFPFAAIALAFVAALGIRYVTETRQRRRVSSLFAQYVPEAVAHELEESGHLEEHVTGERLDVSLLFFCDMRGFTSLSATLEPSQVRAMLNEFYELATHAILTQGGTVLKFVGDEVFAVFGAPLPVENHTQRALDCAMEIQSRAPELDVKLEDLGIPPVKFGIGMNSGDVVAAHIGGGRRRQYDVVGDSVNLASRLCGQAGKGEIVLPEAIVGRLIDPPPMESMGAVALKGLDEPVPLMKVTVGDSEPRIVMPVTPN